MFINLDNGRQTRSLVYMLFFVICAFDWTYAACGVFLALMDLVESVEREKSKSDQA